MSEPKATPSLLDAGTINSQVVGGVATIRFGHPKGNSLPGALLARLSETIAWVGKEPDTRVVVLRSEGTGAFCAGA